LIDVDIFFVYEMQGKKFKNLEIFMIWPVLMVFIPKNSSNGWN
jgi:hypothetical protein